MQSLTLPFSMVPQDAPHIAGGKGASLSRMSAAGLPVPPGFVVCAETFRAFLDEYNGADLALSLTQGLNVNDSAALEAASTRLRSIIVSNPLPARIAGAICESYERLGAEALVAVRSSAVGEDSEAASYAGQQETFLSVRGSSTVVGCVRECWASFFSPRALFYRAQKGELGDTRMAVVVQEMALGERSGVLFTIDPVQKRQHCMLIEAVFGLGEGIVSGALTPDHYLVNREDGSLLQEFISTQETAIVHDPEKGGTKEIKLDEAQGSTRVLARAELQCLRAMGLRLEALFGAPQDVEWCIRGGELLLLQSRPITAL